MFSNQPEEIKSVLDLTLNPPKNGEVIFNGFCAEEHETEGE